MNCWPSIPWYAAVLDELQCLLFIDQSSPVLGAHGTHSPSLFLIIDTHEIAALVSLLRKHITIIIIIRLLLSLSSRRQSFSTVTAAWKIHVGVADAGLLGGLHAECADLRRGAPAPRLAGHWLRPARPCRKRHRLLAPSRGHGDRHGVQLQQRAADSCRDLDGWREEE